MKHKILLRILHVGGFGVDNIGLKGAFIPGIRFPRNPNSENIILTNVFG
jgi:hypothetical protein